MIHFLDEENSVGVAVEGSSNSVYVNNLETVTRFGLGGNELERLGAGFLPTLAEVEAVTPVGVGNYHSGLAVDSGSTGASTVYVADGVHGQIQAYVPEPPGPPTVQTTSVSSVTATSADFRAEVNPRSEPFEAATSYRFEYGPCPSLSTCASSPYESSVPIAAGSLAANYKVDPIGAHLQGLVAHTVYHMRVSVENAHSTSPTLAPEKIFTTQPVAPFSLPDGRVWELVSPPDKHGALIQVLGGVQAAAAGDAIAYETNAPTETGSAGYTNDVAVLSGRGAGGWSSRDLTPPHVEETGLSIGGGGSETRLFSTDLSANITQPFGVFDPQISVSASEQTAFLRSDFPSGQPTAFCATDCYRPLVTACPEGEECPSAVAELADVPAGTPFGDPKCQAERPLICGPLFLAASLDLAHIVFRSTIALTSNPAKGQLYEWSASVPPAEALRPISFLPNGTPAGAPAVGRENFNTRGAVSTDGSRVVFEGESGGKRRLYLRVNATEEASAVSGSAVDGSQCTEPAKACTIQLEGEFQIASADGSKVFTTGGGLYEYDLAKPLGERLADLTAGSEPANIQGTVIGASENGSSVYFAASSVLAHNVVDNGNGPEQAQVAKCEESNATCNLYLSRDGTTSFVTTFSGADRNDWNQNLTGLSARVSPNGQYLAFMSQRPLTGYDNRDAVSGKPDEEVFLYHAGGESESGKLVCASCNPTGARPHGIEFNASSGDGELVEGAAFERHQWVAANIPGWVTGFGMGSRYQPRYLSDSGRLFFNSADALVSSDTNGTEDVYEYEPPATVRGASPSDTCTEQTPTYSPASSGCVDLVSSGTSKEESAFLDASENGDGIFFLTTSRLSPKDFDVALDVYDARVGGGEPEPTKPVECVGDACQSPVVAPEDPTPGSLTFQGPGNLLAPVSALAVKGKAKPLTRAQKLARALRSCTRQPKRKRAGCEGQARRSYGAVGKAKKSKNQGAHR